MRWANSLVDRIVSEPLAPAGAVAEPYALWAIEDQPGLVTPCRHPAIVVTNDLRPYLRLKLFILNLGHTYLAEVWSTKGMADFDGGSGGDGGPYPSAARSTAFMMRKFCRSFPQSASARRRQPIATRWSSDFRTRSSIIGSGKS